MSPRNRELAGVWPGVLDDVPDTFRTFAQEPAFSMDDTTFCFWRSSQEDRWRTSAIEYPEKEDDPDGSGWMLSILEGDPKLYQSWAESYYERPLDLEAISHVYEHKPLTDGTYPQTERSEGYVWPGRRP